MEPGLICWYFGPGSLPDMEPGTIPDIEPGAINNMEPGSITDMEPGSIIDLQFFTFEYQCQASLLIRGDGAWIRPDLYKVLH